MKIGDHETHPLADVFPLMDDESLAGLADDIKVNGLRRRIVLHEEQILDGRNRYLACLKVGVTPEFEDYHGGDTMHGLASYVCSMNMARRDLTPGARALCARRLLKLCAVRKPRQQSSLPGVKTETAAEAEAVLAGTSELQQAVERGDIDVQYAAQAAALPEDDQRSLVERLQMHRTRAIELTHDELEQLRDGYDRLGEHAATRLLERMVPEL